MSSEEAASSVDKMEEDNPVVDGDASKSLTDEPSKTLKNIVDILEKSVKIKETRLLMGRLFRLTGDVRKHFSKELLQKFVQQHVADSSASKEFLLSQLGQIPGDVSMAPAPSTDASSAPTPSSLPEVEMFAYLLSLMFLTDLKRFDQARIVSDAVLTALSTHNRRTLDAIAARIYSYVSLSYEKTGNLEDIRSTLLALHCTATLRHDAIGQETLLNLLLRNYLHYNLVDQAEKFRSKSQKSDQFKSQQQYCRYLFYLGRIRTIQLEYTDARECLMQVSRKAPAIAHDFRIQVQKWLTVVRLLLGEIPDRTDFSTPGMARSLLPYLELTQAVKRGDLDAFSAVATRHAATFSSDKVHNLVTRLHHNVIRAGLRRINLAYARISLAEVAAKLRLASVEDAECIVAKAIRDGGIDAVINHEAGYMQSREVVDVYSTSEPHTAFHARISFCLDIHNDAVKAMRFEPDAHKHRLESADARKERIAQEQELAQAIQEDEDEF